MNRFLSSIALVAALALAACGGGGGGGAPTSGSGSGPTSGGGDGGSANPGTAYANDPVAMVAGNSPIVNGVIAGPARNVTAKYHGPASEGELVEVTVNFADLTYTWKVIQSSYGIDNQQQTGTLKPNTAGAGYLMTTSDGQPGGNLLIMNTGSLFVTGFALTINGTDVKQALFAQPLTGQDVGLPDVVGTYTFGQFDHEAGDHFPFGPNSATVTWGVAVIDQFGTMSVCYGASSFGPNCKPAKQRRVDFNSTVCPDNAAAVSEQGTFIGCMVVAKNGHGNDKVLHLDLQSTPMSRPGTALFVQQSQQWTLSDGTYSIVKVADLSNDPDGCTSQPFVTNGTTLTAQCGPTGSTIATDFAISTMAPLPTSVNGLLIDNSIAAMILPIADGMWIAVSPTAGWSGTDSDRGQILVLVRQ